MLTWKIFYLKNSASKTQEKIFTIKCIAKSVRLIDNLYFKKNLWLSLPVSVSYTHLYSDLISHGIYICALYYTYLHLNFNLKMGLRFQNSSLKKKEAMLASWKYTRKVMFSDVILNCFTRLNVTLGLSLIHI